MGIAGQPSTVKAACYGDLYVDVLDDQQLAQLSEISTALLAALQRG